MEINKCSNINERKGTRTGGSLKRKIKSFNSFIENNFLMDVPMVKRKYTLYKSNGIAKSRLELLFLKNGSKNGQCANNMFNHGKSLTIMLLF